MTGEAKPGILARAVSHRIGKWAILVIWIAIVGVFGPLAGKLTSVERNEMSAWLPSNAESTVTGDIANRFVSKDLLPTAVVYSKKDGLTQADLAAIAAQAKEFSGVERVVPGTTGPIPSAEKPLPQAAFVLVPVDSSGGGWQAMPSVVGKLRAIASKTGNGVTTNVTGPGGTGSDRAEAFSSIDSTLLIAALAVVVVLMLLTYRSPFLWLVPVLSSGLALGVAQGVVYLPAKNTGVTVNAQSAGIMLVLVFGAAADYALLLVARYREELRRNENRHAAMAVALHRAGPAIWCSAATVIVGLLCLGFADLNSTAGLGPVTAIGVAVALLAMTTFFPALLLVFGRWVFWPFRPEYGSADPTKTGGWAKLGRSLARRPRLVWITAALVLGVLALGSLNLKADGLSDRGWFVGEQDSVVGEQVLNAHFPPSTGQPVQVVANAPQAAAVRDAFAGVDGITGVTQPAVRDGYAYIEGYTVAAPDSAKAMDTVVQARAAAHQVPRADARVGGMTATLYDTAQANSHDRDLVIPMVLAVVFLIIAGLLRSLVAPALLIATVVLSFFAALGISTFFFQHVFGFEGADGAYPLFVFVFLVALGVDYNIFLMTRVHEEARRGGTREAALTALASTGGVITSAGLVLAGTFAALCILPSVTFVEVGFTVAVGVLIDTFIVRAVMVTALTLDVGRWMWWPSKLSRRRDPAPAERERVPAE